MHRDGRSSSQCCPSFSSNASCGTLACSAMGAGLACQRGMGMGEDCRSVHFASFVLHMKLSLAPATCSSFVDCVEGICRVCVNVHFMFTSAFTSDPSQVVVCKYLLWKELHLCLTSLYIWNSCLVHIKLDAWQLCSFLPVDIHLIECTEGIN